MGYMPNKMAMCPFIKQLQEFIMNKLIQIYVLWLQCWYSRQQWWNQTTKLLCALSLWNTFLSMYPRKDHNGNQYI